MKDCGEEKEDSILVPDNLAEWLNTGKPLGSREVSAFKKWALSLPEVEFPDPEEPDKKDCCCCCCCCCDKEEEGNGKGGRGSGSGSPAARFVWTPSLMLHVSPTGLRRNIERIEGTFSWTAPPGSNSVTIEWERYAPDGSLLSAFETIGPNYAGLAPSGYTAWDTGRGTWGHRVHIRAITDTGVSSRVRWRDGNQGAGWL